MKHRNIIILLAVLFCFVIMFTKYNKKAKKETLCVKCGNIATATISGSVDTMKKNNIPLSECRKITSNVYSAYVCNSCIGEFGPVIKWSVPDAGDFS